MWLLTHLANAAVIERMCAADGRLADRLHPVYLHFGGRLERLRHAGPLRFSYYIAWQLVLCRLEARRLQASIGFDVCHHLTYASDWAPVGVASVSGVPFVWGPVGGSSTPTSVRLWFRLGARTMVTELLRAAILTPLRMTIGRSLARRAAVVLGQNADVARAFAPVPVTVEPHVALEPEATVQRSARSTGSPVAVYAGRLLGWKGLRLALAALRRPAASAWDFEIYGDGPERRGLERLAESWGLTDRVRFLGVRPRAEVRTALGRADVLLFPSTHDAAGWSVAEAAAAGCPVVALRLGGPATLVGVTDGVLVNPTGDVVGNLAAALDVARAMKPVNRWAADRIPDTLTDIYRRAAGRSPRSVAA